MFCWEDRVKRTVSLGDALAGAVLACLFAGGLPAGEFSVSSPDGKISATLVFDETSGSLSYRVSSDGVAVIDDSPLGINTDKGDFTAGMSPLGNTRVEVNETYTLPVGKRSTYVNRANELLLRFGKNQQQMHVRFRAYDDGIALSYAIPGSGDIEIAGETSAFDLSGGRITYWGQKHPNNYGYETMLGPVTGDRFSMPMLARLGERDHFVFVAQAASYGTYIIPNFRRDGSMLQVSFPMDQEGPVRTSLPFQSPWRLAIISPGNLAKIVQTTMLENLNPPTEPELAGADWIKPGRASWDYLAGDRNDPRRWIDFDVDMGWEYHLVDAGFERRFDVPQMTRYARERNIRMIGWGYTPDLNTREKAERVLSHYAEMGLSGAKLDFFDHHPFTGEKKTHDFEDTQASLQMRDYLMETAAEEHLVLEFHGSAVPSGERRRYPHFMTAESVAGMEKRNGRIENDLTIPYVRNIMGPTSFTIVKFDRSVGSHAYQMGQSVVYEAGIQIYAERHDRILAFAGVEFFKKVPSSWDETTFIDGYPASHAIYARRKGSDWFLGGMTDQPRIAEIPLTFLTPGTSYRAQIYRDGSSPTDLVIEQKTVTSEDTLEIPMQQAGGFAVHMH
ncbi:MAG: glycoside hydrolase family 97 N-terminal domain-containing protein [Pirellulales bacterium]|nr:glycoside hydrolase family 97 N-terminal domain-containing protein [Pirellulales bacterium]